METTAIRDRHAMFACPRTNIGRGRLRRRDRSGSREVGEEHAGMAIVVVVGERGTQEPVRPLLGQWPGLGEHDRHRREPGRRLPEAVGDDRRSDVSSLNTAE